ncbi:MAG: N-acetyl sugar amidotransferase [Azospirillum sp.]|nr:N-acetyl sugar amidotransferase [Azospirillum sp.]
MRQCARCLYTEAHPLNLTLDERWVCSGCRVHEEKDALDWRARWEMLRELADAYRGRGRTLYDCVVPVSGARDSHFIVHTVKKRLGLNPLLVSYNRHYNTDLGIRNLANLRMALDVDLLQKTAQPAAVKAVMRATIERLGNFHWHVLAGQTAFPVQVAVRMGIPLVVWGAHQGVDQVGMFSHTDAVEMSRRYRKEHDLMGVEIEDLEAEFPELRAYNLAPWRYPSAADIARVGVRGIYLSNYVRWDSKAQHERMIDLYGYETRPLPRTFDAYNDVDCHHYAGLHDRVKLAKHGYSKVVDHACREIRLRRLSREQAQALVDAHRDRASPDGALLAAWLRMDEAAILDRAKAHCNPKAFDANGTAQAVRPPGNAEIEAARLGPPLAPCEFRATPTRAPGRIDDRYVLIGKGVFDPEDVD